MKITFITPYPDPNKQHAKNTGVGSYSMYLVNALEKEGIDIDIFAHKDAGLEEANTQGIHVFRVWKKSFGGLFALFGKIIQAKPKLVHIQHEVNIFGNELILPLTPFIAGLVRLCGGKVITTFHGGMGLKEIDKVFIQENGKKLPPCIIKFAFRYIFGLFSFFSNQIIVHEPFQKQQLVDEHHISEKKITVIPHGVPESPETIENAKEKLEISNEKNVYLYMGFAARYKGLAEMLPYAHEFLKKNPNALLIIGAGPAPRLEKDEEYMNWYTNLESKYKKIGDQVRWVGFIPSDEIALYYSAADALIFPYSRRLAASGPMALAIGYEKDMVLSSILEGEKDYNFDFENITKTTYLKPQRTWKQVAKETIQVYGK